MKPTRFIPLLALLLTPASAATLFSPDGATATNQFGPGFLIDHAIDGSGLPANFDENSQHAAYQNSNHWTTEADQVVGVSATFTFNSATTVAAVVIWEHQASILDNLANNQDYAITNFDLEFLNGSGTQIAEFTSIDRLPTTSVGQVYTFPEMTGVRSVVLTINSNEGLGTQSPNFTGLGEIAFSSDAIPEPSSAALALIGGLGAICRRHRS